MSEVGTLIQLQDLDVILDCAADPAARDRLAAMGFEIEGVAAVRRTRARLVAGIERRWLMLYERAQRRYGRGVAAVRERVCQGCFITLPTSAQPASGQPMMCESCGRILYWSAPVD